MRVDPDYDQNVRKFFAQSLYEIAEKAMSLPDQRYKSEILNAGGVLSLSVVIEGDPLDRFPQWNPEWKDPA